jgi:hypothetical protein
VSLFSARRGFLKAVVSILTGTAFHAVPVQSARAARRDGLGTFNTGVTPNHSQELLVRLPDIDGIHLRRAAEGDIPVPPGLVLGLFRYEAPSGASKTIHRFVLPGIDIRAGLYVRSAVPYRTRMILDPDNGELMTRIILGQRESIAVYRETPLWVEEAPWQVVMLIGASVGKPQR